MPVTKKSNPGLAKLMQKHGKDFKNARKAKNPYRDCAAADGKYVMRLVSVDYSKSAETNKDAVMFRPVIVCDHEGSTTYAGESPLIYKSLTELPAQNGKKAVTMQSLMERLCFTIQDFGYETDNLEPHEFEELLEVMSEEKPVVIATLKTKGEYQNVNVQTPFDSLEAALLSLEIDPSEINDVVSDVPETESKPAQQEEEETEEEEPEEAEEEEAEENGDDLDGLSRKELKKLRTEEGMDFPVYPSMDDDAIREKIREERAGRADEPAEAEEAEEDDEEDWTLSDEVVEAVNGMSKTELKALIDSRSLGVKFKSSDKIAACREKVLSALAALPEGVDAESFVAAEDDDD